MSIKRKLKLISIHIKRSPQAMSLATLLLKTQLESIKHLSDKLDISCLDFYLEDYCIGDYAWVDSAQQRTDDLTVSNEDTKEDTDKVLENKMQKIYTSICSGFEKNFGHDTEADLIGFSTYIWNRQLVVFLSKQLKEKFPMLIIFAGGAESSADPESLLKDGRFDFVIKGEAELTLTHVLKELLAGNRGLLIPGVYVNTYKTNINTENINKAGINKSEITTGAPLIMDLDSIPSVFLSGNVDLQNQKAILWELSRGCRFLCTYCYEGLGVKTVRQFSLSRVRSELQLFESHQIAQVFVLDPIFNQDPKRTRDILELIQEITPQIHFIFEVRTEYLTAEIVSMFSKVHCTLQIGLESSNPLALKSVKRGFHSQKYREKINLLNEHGIAFGLDLIYGLPHDTLSGFKESLNYAFSLQPNHLDIFPLSVLPGTELNLDKEHFHLNVMAMAPYTLLSSPTFSEKNMNDAKYLSNAIDIFYNRGMAVPWFFMVVETLELSPSEFFLEFSKWVFFDSTKEISALEILDLQLGFLKAKFAAPEHQKSFGVLKDIVQYHSALNQSMLAGPSLDTSVAAKVTSKGNANINSKGGAMTKSSQNAFEEFANQPEVASRGGFVGASIENQLFQLAESVKIIQLKYRVEDLTSVGGLTFDEFLFIATPTKTFVLFYNYYGEVITEEIDIIWATLLQQFTKANSVDKVCANQPYKDFERAEIIDFIKFSFDQHILILR